MWLWGPNILGSSSLLGRTAPIDHFRNGVSAGLFANV
jgi:hypothetical protein